MSPKPRSLCPDLNEEWAKAEKSLTKTLASPLAKLGRNACKKSLDPGVSFDQVRDALTAALVEAYPPADPERPWDDRTYVCDVFDDVVVFERRVGGDGAGTLYSSAYTFTNGTAALSGEPVEVVRTYAAANPAPPPPPPAQPAAAPPPAA